jgi:hypothetical protein
VTCATWSVVTLEIVIGIVIVPYGGDWHVAATELHHLGGCLSTQKIVRQEEFFTHRIQEKIIFKILCRLVRCKFFFLVAECIHKICML